MASEVRGWLGRWGISELMKGSFSRRRIWFTVLNLANRSKNYRLKTEYFISQYRGMVMLIKGVSMMWWSKSLVGIGLGENKRRILEYHYGPFLLLVILVSWYSWYPLSATLCGRKSNNLMTDPNYKKILTLKKSFLRLWLCLFSHSSVFSSILSPFLWR